MDKRIPYKWYVHEIGFNDLAYVVTGDGVKVTRQMKKSRCDSLAKAHNDAIELCEALKKEEQTNDQ